MSAGELRLKSVFVFTGRELDLQACDSEVSRPYFSLYHLGDARRSSHLQMTPFNRFVHLSCVFARSSDRRSVREASTHTQTAVWLQPPAACRLL